MKKSVYKLITCAKPQMKLKRKWNQTCFKTLHTINALNHNSHILDISKTFKKEKKKLTFAEVPLSVHARDIPQVTARGNKSRVAGQEMCRHMYLPLPGASFHSCEWVRRRWKPLCTPCPHSFLLNCPHKLSHGCCNMNLFPLSLPPGLSHSSLSLLFWICLSQVFLLTSPFIFSAVISPHHHHLSLSVPTSKCAPSSTQAVAKLVIFLAFIL